MEQSEIDELRQLIADFKCNEKSAEFWQRECAKLIQALDETTPAAKKWWQVYQDQCEGAYVEATIVKELRRELAEARGVINEALGHLRFANPRNGPTIRGIGILEAAKKD